MTSPKTHNFEVWLYKETCEIVFRIYKKREHFVSEYEFRDGFDFEKHWDIKRPDMWIYLGVL